MPCGTMLQMVLLSTNYYLLSNMIKTLETLKTLKIIWKNPVKSTWQATVAW